MSSRLSPTPVKSVAPAKPKYLALVRKFPLRLIQSEEENEAALAVLEVTRRTPTREAPRAEEHDYIAVLAKLIEEYESSRYPRGPVAGAAMLAHLIEAKGITQARLAGDTGFGRVDDLANPPRPTAS